MTVAAPKIPPHITDSPAYDFLSLVVGEGATILFRPIETWTEGGKKKSRVLFKSIIYRQCRARIIQDAIDKLLPIVEREHANLFYGVCPRVGGNGHYDQKWAIRTVRTLWADVDHCKPSEAVERCNKAGLPMPSIVVSSGNGCHLYWLLSEPYQIDDAPKPPPVCTDWNEPEEGKPKKKREWFKHSETGDRVYLDEPGNTPQLSPKALLVQDVMVGIAAKVGGDHTQDLSRLMRLPGTMNRKDERNGRAPVPCEIVSIDATLRYQFADFERFSNESPDKIKREKVRAISLPTPRRLSPTKRDKLDELITACSLAPVGQRSQRDFDLCCFAVRKGVAQAELWGLVQSVGKFAQAGERYFQRTWEAAEADAREQIYARVERKHGFKASASNGGGNGHHTTTGTSHVGEPVSSDDQDQRPEIEVSPEEHAVNDAAINALSSDATLFQRGGLLVQIVCEGGKKKGILRPDGSPRIVPIEKSNLRERLTRAAKFVVTVKTEDGEKQIRKHPPDFCAPAILARGQWDNIRRLETVTEMPVLKPNGAILQVAGFDEETGIFYRPNVDFPPIDDEPSQQDATFAKDELLEVSEDFPFENESHRAGWLASVLTPFARPAFKGPSPFMLVDANAPAVGKGLLNDCTSHIVFGRDFARMAACDKDVEWSKQILAIGMAGDAAVLIDNIAGTFGAASLDAALTAETWSGRWLGETRMVTCPLRVTWYGTGNNVILKGDLPRRVLHIRLNSPLENPEERSDFAHPELLTWVLANRPRLVCAALTILRAYCRAGRPKQTIAAWGSFQGWCDLVCGAVAWVGMPDPSKTRINLNESTNSEANQLQQLIAGWKEIDPNREGCRIADVLAALAEERNKLRFDTLRAALADIFNLKPGNLPGAKSMGMKFHHWRKRVANGEFLDREIDDHKIALWFVGPRNPSGTTVLPGTTGN